MAPGPKTTWEDLSNLGWLKQQIYNTLNAQRGNSMNGVGDLALNDSFATDYGWYCYNVLRGSPRETGFSPETTTSDETVWTYDNSKSLQPFETTVTETWTDSASATLSISTNASISLGTSIDIAGVASSEFNITIGTESTSSETKENSHTLSQTWTIVVGPGEIVTIDRVKTTVTGNATYEQDYGLYDNSIIGTKGNKWNDHYYWGFNANYYLNTPKGTMILNGYSEKTNFTFKIIRTTIRTGNLVDGQRALELAKPTFALVGGSEGRSEKIIYAVHGPT